MNQPILRAISPIKLTEVIDWCRELEPFQTQVFNTQKATPVARFAIGWYQVWGGVDWSACPSVRNESLAAACVHWVACMESLNVHIEDHYPNDLIWGRPHNSIDWKQLCYHSSRACQMCHYHPSIASPRASRYNPNILGIHLGRCFGICLDAIYPEERSQALYDAMRIMTEDLRRPLTKK